MCGLAGFFDVSHRTKDELVELAGNMAATLSHRGPDDHGIWADPDVGIALAHQRLSIVDLSIFGHQPMESSCGRFIIAYNGEIYNVPELLSELKNSGRVLRGHSDTEVLLECCAELGAQQTLNRLIGMFAFALWDRKTKTLSLARDRMGIKPLYWGRCGSLLLFGSELKALKVHPGWTPTIDRDALALFVRYGYVSAPYTIYQNMRKLEPGCLLQVQVDSTPTIQRYWSLIEVASQGINNMLTLSDDEATNELEKILVDSVKRRMVADVPLGAFLSGGIDSSTVAALMQVHSDLPIRSFSIGFEEMDFNEAPYAAQVAAYLGTDHTELYVTSKQAQEVITRLPEIYDEPFADPSQIPTFLVSELARQHVTVALSGDGGDEIFGGYNRYVLAKRIAILWRYFPKATQNAMASIIQTLPPVIWNQIFRMIPSRWRPLQAADKLSKIATVLGTDPDQFYSHLVSRWAKPEQLVKGGNESTSPFEELQIADNFPNIVDRMQVLDGLTYLPDDVLTKLDRASMAASLEGRVPLLDHRVVEFAWRLPHHFKIRNGQGKWILRKVLNRYLPRTLIERPKMGFGVPLDKWLRGSLRDWAEELLQPHRLAVEGFFYPTPIRKVWEDHLSGRQNNQYALWTVLMFQYWLDKNSP